MTCAILVSFIILIISIVVVCVNRSKRFTKTITILIIGVSAAILALFCYMDYTAAHTVSFIPIAILHTMQIMALNYDIYDIPALFSEGVPLVCAWMYVYISLLFIALPVLTSVLILSHFKNILAHIIAWLRKKANTYVFTDLNIKSMALASSVRKEYKKAKIVFLNVTAEKRDSGHELTENARKIRALMFNNNSIKIRSPKAEVTFFAIDDSESKNLEDALGLIEKYKNREKTELYVFSASNEGMLLLDPIDKGCMKVRRVSETRSLVYRHIQDNPITDDITVIDGRKIISALIVGFGGYGTELVKALLWCGQLPGYDLEINVIDKDPLAEDKFTALCPEIMSLNNNTIAGEAHYSLNFHGGIDVMGQEFYDTVKKLGKTSVVYVSLGNDELNIETSINLRIAFERMGISPKIRAIVYSDVKHKMLSGKQLANFKNESYDIDMIGNIKSRYSYDDVVDKRLEAAALECHMRYIEPKTPENIEQEKQKFNKYEYLRKSSLAEAIYEKYRDREKITGETANLFEHIRWNAYMRTEGYIYSGSRDKSSRSDLAKMHNNLHEYNLLSEEDRSKDKRITEV